MFTDVVLIDDETGSRAVGKVLTTPEDPSEGVESGLAELLGREGVDARQVGTIVHGTTLVTNALIERRGAKTALLTTEGFRDALAIGTEHRYDMYDVFIEKPEPLVPRSLRYGVRERSLDDGSVMLGLDEEQARAVVAELRERGVRAVAVSFLHSFRNPAHERRVGEILRERPRRSRFRSPRRSRRTFGSTSVPRRRLPMCTPGRWSRVICPLWKPAAGDSASTGHSTSCSRTAVRPV